MEVCPEASDWPALGGEKWSERGLTGGKGGHMVAQGGAWGSAVALPGTGTWHW
jgi:hypothetical protein